MLSLRQLDSIVHSNLRSLKGFKIENRREEGTYIFYDVYDNPKSGKRLIGTYQVWEYHDGSARSGWIPFETNDSEIEKIRNRIWQAIMAIAIPANLTTERDESQATNIIADNLGGTITYKRNEHGQVIPTGGAVNPGYYLELGQGVAIRPENTNRKNSATIRDFLSADKKHIPLGKLLYMAAKDVVAMSPHGVMPEIDSHATRENNSRIVMSYAFSLVTRGDDYDPEAEKELLKSGFFDFSIPRFARVFLQSFPTLSSAIARFNRPIPLSDFLSKDTQGTVDQILNLTVEEASTLVKAKPLLEQWKNEFSSLRKEMEPSKKLDKPKQKGRYRLTKSEIKTRRKIVSEAERIYKESSPKKTWKQVAYELDIPERTLRDWRHNPIYK